ncbi:BRO family protein [Helicobacter sp. MIT 21-1697]|uniref:BRO-N domain-containing protein n=1 Tax=Helicobacter sp. MIT 21-1697 TaxID=2993733 RepID=UPI00224A58B2|nr:BRO family protein [Helicobacter sp. MIT 21-1697]MCX2717802.1 BRO family protein [Helicobacter sp. MIT 21-1697]
MQLQVFNQNGFKVRGGLIEDKPYFVAMDIAKALEYSETAMMLRRLDDDEIMELSADLAGGFSKHASAIKIINESGLYNAILGSKKPQAKAFKKWITSEVLPSIRKQGYYVNAESTLIAELRDSNLSKDALKKQNENLKDELLSAQKELINFYKTHNPRSKVKEHSTEIIAKIQELHKNGMGTMQIVRALGVSESSVRKYKERK